MTDEEILKTIADARAERDGAQKRVRELEAELKQTRADARSKVEGLTLRDALRSAGVAAKALDDAAAIVRREADLLDFDDQGGFEFASYRGKTTRDAHELAAAFVEAWPSFTQKHVDAVARANGSETHGSDEERDEAWKDLDPVAIADLAFPPRAEPPRSPATVDDDDWKDLHASEMAAEAWSKPPVEKR